MLTHPDWKEEINCEHFLVINIDIIENDFIWGGGEGGVRGLGL